MYSGRDKNQQLIEVKLKNTTNCRFVAFLQWETIRNVNCCERCHPAKITCEWEMFRRYSCSPDSLNEIKRSRFIFLNKSDEIRIFTESQLCFNLCFFSQRKSNRFLRFSVLNAPKKSVNVLNWSSAMSLFVRHIFSIYSIIENIESIY